MLPCFPCPKKPLVSRHIAGSIHRVSSNQAELEVARLLDYYRIPWAYEPHSFPLEEDEHGRVVEAACPDFYLPDQDLYLEITTMRQSLVTRKNRKMRKLRERYPT